MISGLSKPADEVEFTMNDGVEGQEGFKVTVAKYFEENHSKLK